MALYSVIATALLVLQSCSSTILPSTDSPQSVRSISRVLDSSEQLEARTSRLLADHVDEDGLVNYPALVESSKELNSIYAEIAARSPDSDPASFSNEEAKFAYWLNSYNSAVLYAVTRVYPIESVRDHRPISPYSLISGGGFFAAQKFIFGGESYSLYQLENDLIRERFPDPKLHFALNCASIGCPDLLNEAYQASKLQDQLDRQTRAFVNSSKGFQIDHDARTINISSIFDWYESDFIDYLEKENVESPVLLDYLDRYLDEPRRQDLREARQRGYKLSYLTYDWSLNGTS